MQKSKNMIILLLCTFLPSLLFSNSYNSNIINISFNGIDTILFLLKDQALINIVEITPDSISELRAFQLLDLKNNDNKNTSNDEGTPEGIYFINELINIKDYNNPAVPTAAVLNYPNPVDIYNKRTGNDVWIQNRTSTDSMNKSCFYLKNNDLEDLLAYVKLNSTPIIILKTSDNSFQDNATIFWQDYIKKWQESFGSKMLVSHFSMYITDTDEIDFQYAKKINSTLTMDNVVYEFSIDNLVVLSTPNESIMSFQFLFKSNDYSLEKPFSLSLLPIDKEWKIISENSNYNPKPIKKTEHILKEKLYKLIKAWENKDFNSYISFYDKTFTDGSRSYKQYYNYKRKSFRNLNDIRIGISDLKIQKLDISNWLVSFNQDYWTENYQDFGKKEIIFQCIGDDFFIVKEHWSELQKN